MASDRGKKTIQHLLSLSGTTEPPFYVDRAARVEPGPGFAATGFPFTPEGNLNLRTAENWLLRPELVVDYKATINDDFTKYDLSYVSPSQTLLDSIARYFNKYFQPKKEVTTQRIAVAPGASDLLDTLFHIILDDGEGALIQAPYWPGFSDALTTRNKNVAVEVHVPFEDGKTFFAKEIVKYYEEAYNRHQNVKGLIICNPQNPLGGSYPKETLVELLKFAQDKDLHVVVDEIYRLSIYDGSPSGDIEEPWKTFTSVLSIDYDEIGVDEYRVHVVYSFSKDLNSSGIRLGIFVSQDNKKVVEGVQALQEHKVSSFTLLAADKLLAKDDFVYDLLINKNPELIKDNFGTLRTTLLDAYNIPYVEPAEPRGGLFAFINFLAVAPGKTEEELNQEFTDAGVALLPGTSLYSPRKGWFRLISTVEKGVLVEAIVRIKKVLGLE